MVEPTGWEIQDGYRAAQRLLTLPEPPTAILASNDRTATGVLLCALRQGCGFRRTSPSWESMTSRAWPISSSRR